MKHLVFACASMLLALVPAPARADGFIVPFAGYNFGGDAGCPSLTDCADKRLNFGVAFGSMGRAVGFEQDISYARNFFGETPGADNSVFSAMSNLLVGPGVGPIRPYFVVGVGLIRPHVSSLVGSVTDFDASRNSFGYDLGGGLTVMLGPVGIRGDIRRFRTVESVDLLIFTGQKLDFWRASAGLALTF
jgi:opacity protein-like surface antigen